MNPVVRSLRRGLAACFGHTVYRRELVKAALTVAGGLAGAVSMLAVEPAQNAAEPPTQAAAALTDEPKPTNRRPRRRVVAASAENAGRGAAAQTPPAPPPSPTQQTAQASAAALGEQKQALPAAKPPAARPAPARKAPKPRAARPRAAKQSVARATRSNASPASPFASRPPSRTVAPQLPAEPPARTEAAGRPALPAQAKPESPQARQAASAPAEPPAASASRAELDRAEQRAQAAKPTDPMSAQESAEAPPQPAPPALARAAPSAPAIATVGALPSVPSSPEEGLAGGKVVFDVNDGPTLQAIVRRGGLLVYSLWSQAGTVAARVDVSCFMTRPQAPAGRWYVAEPQRWKDYLRRKHLLDGRGRVTDHAYRDPRLEDRIQVAVVESVISVIGEATHELVAGSNLAVVVPVPIQHSWYAAVKAQRGLPGIYTVRYSGGRFQVSAAGTSARRGDR